MNDIFCTIFLGFLRFLHIPIPPKPFENEIGETKATFISVPPPFSRLFSKYRSLEETKFFSKLILEPEMRQKSENNC